MSILATSIIHWSTTDIPLFGLLVILLIFSGCFSSSETALFGLTHSQRLTLRRRRSIASRAVDALLSDQRMLLITILFGNMLVNVLYFVVSSVLLIRAESSIWIQAILGIAFLLIIVAGGEVIPKVLANANRVGFIRILAPPLLTMHRFIGPFRVILNSWVIAPLSRLTSPPQLPPELDEEELNALLDISGRQGVIDTDEQRGLQEVINLSRLRVRDVMTPRVKMVAISQEEEHEEILATIRKSRLTRIPIYQGDLDHIVGNLSVKAYLTQSQLGAIELSRAIYPMRYVPEIATLDQLLEHFRSSASKIAVAVDEYGGTSGIVSLEDIVEELVGDIVAETDQQTTPPVQIEPGAWRVSGGLSIRDWPEVLGHLVWRTNVVTLGGLIFDRLGRAPSVGDIVKIGNIRIEVEAVDSHHVTTALVKTTSIPESKEDV
ncbi:MAG: hemolysin family protein [Phycisphaerales bacterium]|nr:hemolysin family protein [Phycisphaerales bacterium]